MKTIKAWWPTRPHPGNMGDILTPVILEKLFGVKAQWVPPDQPGKLICVGSVINKAVSGDVVIGAGIMRAADKLADGVKVLAVRGPRTAKVCGLDVPLGDPALLLPRFHGRPVNVTHDISIAPHYVDNDIPRHRAHTINLLDADPLAVVDDIRRCRRLVSSSLHGIIVAHAYGIPACWVKYSNKLCGDGSKFADYAESVGVELKPVQLSGLEDIGLLERLPFVLPEKIDTDGLYKVMRDFTQTE